ncbi:MAG: hypothetical protein DRN00_05305 [Thermoplasmata archaeon]|nr:MAG: hypothetical protein DRN00_05305 [Thermoplasmata archaeon]
MEEWVLDPKVLEDKQKLKRLLEVMMKEIAKNRDMILAIRNKGRESRLCPLCLKPMVWNKTFEEWYCIHCMKTEEEARKEIERWRR